MKGLFGIELICNKHGKYVVVDIKKRIRQIYIRGDNEACYAAYRAITGVNVQRSREAVKPWIKIWEGEK